MREIKKKEMRLRFVFKKRSGLLHKNTHAHAQPPPPPPQQPQWPFRLLLRERSGDLASALGASPWSERPGPVRGGQARDNFFETTAAAAAAAEEKEVVRSASGDYLCSRFVFSQRFGSVQTKLN